jgi:PAS domain S-box-containing protein
LAYFVCAECGSFLSARDSPYVSFWLPAGLYVGVLLLNGRRMWPWLALAAFPANALFDLLHGTKLVGTLLFYCANTVQAVIGAWLVNRFAGERPTLATLREFLALLGFAAGLSTMFGAAIGAETLTLTGLSHSFMESSKVWWGSNAMAIMLVSPFVLTWFSRSGANYQPFKRSRKLVEATLLLSVLIALTWHLLVADKGTMGSYKFSLLLPLLWAGLRFGPRGAAAANLFLAFLLTFFSTRLLTGLTPDQIASGEHIFVLQTFLGVAALVGLIPAIVLGERDRTMAELRESEERFRHLTEASFEGIGVSDNGRIVDVNDQLLKMFGYERGEIIGREVLDLIAPESRLIVEESIRLCREEIFEHRLVRKDGSSFYGEARAKYVRVGNRSLRMAALRDVTERKQAEQALRESEQRYRALVEFLPVAVAVSVDDRVVYLNPAGVRMILTNASEDATKLIGRSVYDFTPVALHDFMRERRRNVLQRGTVEPPIEGPLLRSDGTSILVEALAVPFAYAGQPAILNLFRDITERKQAEELTRTQRQVLEMIALGKPMLQTLDALLRMTESQSTEMLCSILLLDADGVHIRHGAAPSLPADYWKAIDGSAIGPRAGSCGTAAFRGEAVYVADILSDPLWEDYKHLALPYGLRACWSTPIFDAQHHVLGTFAIYYRHPGMPDERHLRLIDMATQTAAVCIDKHRADQALRESEERYRTVVEFFPECVAVSVDDRLVYVNPAGVKLIGAEGPESRAKLIGRPVYDFMPAALRDFVREKRREVLQGGVAGPLIQGSMIRPDGSSVTAEGQAIPFVYDGRPAILSVIRDITEGKRAEAALRESEEKFSKAFRSSPDAVALSDLETGRYIEINEGYVRLFGLSREEVIGRTSLEQGIYQDPKDRDRLVEELRAHGVVRDIELRCWTRHRQPLICLCGGELIELGGRPFIVSVIHDITDRVRAAEALRENQRMLSTLLSNLPGMVYRCQNDADWTMEFISEGCREVTGHAPEEFLGNRKMSYGSIIHSEDQRAVFEAVQTALRDRQPFELTYRIRTSGGAEKWVWERGRGIFSANGELWALEGFVTDFTAKRQAEIERAEALLRERQAREEYTGLLIASQEAERRRIAGELHDSLGQNLLLIKNRAHLALNDRTATSDSRTQLEGIQDLAAQAIAEVRQISQNLHPYQLDQLGVTRAIAAMIDNAAQSSSVTFERKLESVDEVFQGAAATNLYRVVQEALNNILKHSQASRARIVMERDVCDVRLWIEDDGRGFATAGHARDVTSRGFGLKNIAERMRILGGSLNVDSRPGAGTRLEAIIPIADGGEPAANSASQLP